MTRGANVGLCFGAGLLCSGIVVGAVAVAKPGEISPTMWLVVIGVALLVGLGAAGWIAVEL